MKTTFRRLCVLIPILMILVCPALRAQQIEKTIIPKTKTLQIIMSHAEAGKKPYLSFPCVIRLNEQEVLITYKRGTAHGSDTEADCDAVRFNTLTNKIVSHTTLGSLPDLKFQLTVPLRLPDGGLQFYTDMQHQGQDNKNYRVGMHYAESRDEGKTVKGWKKLDLIDGIEYGYPLDFITEGKVIYMLAMSFGYRPGSTWSVAVLKSEDGTRTWKWVKNITKELGGGAINESCFVRIGSDFYVVSRGYAAQETRIARFDKNFNLIKVADLTGKDRLLQTYIGWPRIFYRDGKLYVIGRVWTRPREGKVDGKEKRLGLLRIDPDQLHIEQVALLDNADENIDVKDGYYPAPYWQKVGEDLWFNAVTYKTTGSNPPDIIRLAYRWDEIK